MTPLAVLRHGPTAWNRARRMQGRRDLALDAEAVATFGALAVPAEMAGWRVLSSPLARAAETARLITGRAVPIDVRLIEADWGAWEGRTHAELSDADGAAFRAQEARGLDFQPPGGESPRMVQARLRPFLADLGAAGAPTLAVTHRGVINALLALATGWTMLGKPPVKLADGHLHIFAIDATGQATFDRANIPLRAR